MQSMLTNNLFLWPQRLCPAVRPKSLSTKAWGLVAVLACSSTLAQTEPQQQLRKQELRSAVRQVVATPAGPRQTPAELAADESLRHLNAQERSELRRQLTRDLRAQRSSTETIRR